MLICCAACTCFYKFWLIVIFICFHRHNYLVMGVDLFSFAYAATIAAGGLVGYFKAGSTVSLGAGLLFGGLAGFGAYRSSTSPGDHWLSLGISLSLSGLMGARYYSSGKFMPAGLVALMSVAMVGKCLYGLRNTEVKAD